MNADMQNIPVVPIPGSERWSRAYDWGRELGQRFPGQDGEDLAYACEYNGYGPAAELGISALVMEQQGENDGADWRWRVTFENGSTWIAEGGCDYTGWDCQSYLNWEQAS